MSDFATTPNHTADFPQFMPADCPLTPARVQVLREQGREVGHLYIDPKTGCLMANTGPGGTYELAHAWIREQVTGIPYRDPSEVDPLIPAAALGDPILNAHHRGRARGMLLYLLEFNRPRMMQHPRLDAAVDGAIASLVELKASLAVLPDVYARWDLLLERTISRLEQGPVIRKAPQSRHRRK